MSKLIIPEIGYVLAKVETTPGTKISLAVADVQYVEDFSFAYTMDNISRRPVSPGRQGSMSRAGKRRVEWSATTEFAMPDAFAIASMDPHPDVLMQACGFARQDVSDAGPTGYEGSFYVLQASNHASASFEAYTFTADGADANVGQGRGARSDFSIGINPDDGRLMLTLSGGRALEAATASETYEAAAAQSRAVTYYDDKPFLSSGMYCLIVSLASPEVIYGGGTRETPSNNFQVVSMTINGGMSPTEQTGISATSGVARQRLAPTDPVTMSISIEEALIAASADQFDPYQLRDNETPIEIRLSSDQTDISGNDNKLSINAFGQIIGVTRTAGTGRALWDLELELRYPEDSTDSIPVVGISPTQVFTGGTNAGLFEAPTLTIDGVLCIGFIKS